jgi:hypothetical protein
MAVPVLWHWAPKGLMAASDERSDGNITGDAEQIYLRKALPKGSQAVSI